MLGIFCLWFSCELLFFSFCTSILISFVGGVERLHCSEEGKLAEDLWIEKER